MSDLTVSEGQKALFFFSQAYPQSPVYNVGYLWRIQGNCDLQRLREALVTLTLRHPILRSTFAKQEGILVRKVHEDWTLPFKTLEIESFGEEGLSEQYLSSLRRPFALEKEFSWAWTCVLEKQQPKYLILVWHHIVGDLWTQMIVMDELRSLLLQEPLPEPSADYSEVVKEQQAFLASPKAKKEIAAWSEILGPSEPIQLPLDLPRPKADSFARGCVAHRFESALAHRLQNFAEAQGVSMFTLVLAAYQLLLWRYSGQKSFLVGAPVSGRSGNRFARTCGFFVNTLAYPAQIHPEESFLDFLAKLQAQVRSSLRRKEVPYPVLVKELGKGIDRSRPAFFQVVFGWEEPNHFLKSPRPQVTQAPDEPELWDLGTFGLELKEKLQITEFELMLRITSNQGELTGFFEYNSSLFQAERLKGLLDSLDTLLADLVNRPELPVGELAYLTPGQRKKLLHRLGPGPIRPIEPCTFPELVAKRLDHAPYSPALWVGGRAISYAELDKRANRLAHWLVGKGLQQDALVGLCAQPSVELVVALLAIQKAGAGYLPLDPKYPQDRLYFMVQDAQIDWALCTDNPLLPESCQVIDIAQAEGFAQELSPQAPEGRAKPEGLAYGIYTSGSTGVPKGVLLEHRGLVNLIGYLGEFYGISLRDRVLQLGSLNFDISIFEIGLCLGQGACLVLAPRAELLPGPGLTRILKENQVSTLFITPSSLAALPDTALPDLTKIIAGGEACSSALVNRWGKKRRFFNAYGPTETTIAVSSAELGLGQELVPLGRPLANLRLYVLDEQRQLQLPGAVGELYVGGAGLARGYLNRPELDQERFLTLDLGLGPERLYKTGDQVRFGSQGQLYFQGRGDEQIKLRGFRIEPGEIEVQMAQAPGVTEAKVLLAADPKSGPTLVGFYLGPCEPSALRHFLEPRLPAHMVPGRLLPLPAFPLTPNGKIDLKALAQIQPVEKTPASTAQVSENGVAQKVTELWAELLGHRRFSLETNFFEADGDSLLLAHLHRRLEETFGVELSVIDLFQNPNVLSMAGLLAGKRPELLQATLALPLAPSEEPVALIGMAGSFPGAAGVEALWSLLKEGREGIRFFNPTQLEQAGVPWSLAQNPRYVPARGWIEGVREFDAGFFGVSPAEAQLIDPQQRLFLQAAYWALEDAGIDPVRFEGRIGVFGGSGNSLYLTKNLLPNTELMARVGNLRATLGNDKDFLCSRVSYKLNLTGPALVVQSACSTSLVAVHQAVRSLLSGECEVALAGGVSLVELTESGYLYEPGGIGSPDGHCRPFDQKAQGTVPGQGVGMVVLKRLSAAQKDLDGIYAVLKGTAVNNDGANKVGYTAPGLSGQKAVLEAALAKAGVRPFEVDYIEAHGTATPLGDPIEMASLAAVYGGRSPEIGPLYVGSAKGNLGHLDAAAGVTGLIKLALMVDRGLIPQSLHFQTPNPALNLPAGPFEVPQTPRPWPRKERLGAVSSFGLGGTNAHALVAQAPPCSAPETPEPEESEQLLVLSAKTPEALADMGERLAQHLERNPNLNLRAVAKTLGQGRGFFEHSLNLVAQDSPEVVQKLRHLPTKTNHPTPAGVAMMFPGQGTQYVEMALGLYRSEPVFKKALDKGAQVFGDLTGKDLIWDLYPAAVRRAQASERLGQSWLTQPAVFCVEQALFQFWTHLGVRPSALIGHSVGEYTAAFAAGSLGLEEALFLLCERGRLVQELPPGDMVSLNLSPEALAPWLEGQEELSLAAINGPNSLVVSGPTRGVQQFAAELEAQGVVLKRLFTSHAFHSSMLDPILPDFAKVLGKVTFAPPKLPWISNVTGTWADPLEVTTPQYWVRHLRDTVRFSEGLACLLAQEKTGLLEVGPGGTLSALALQHPGCTPDRLVVQSLPRALAKDSDRRFFLGQLGRLWEAKLVGNLDLGGPIQKLHLPTYPFAKESHWVEATPRTPLLALGPKLYKPRLEPWSPQGAEALPPKFRLWIGPQEPTGHQEQAFGFVPWPLEADFSGLPSVLGLLPKGEVQVVLEPPAGGAQGLAELLHLVRIFAETGRSLDLRLLTRNLPGSRSNLQFSVFAGAFLTVPLEHPNFRTQQLELETKGYPALLWKQLNQKPTEPKLTLTLEGVFRPAYLPLGTLPKGSPLKKDGVYLITGATGGLGTALCLHLWERYQARLVLASRDPQQGQAKRPAVAGAEALWVKMDLNDPQWATKAVEEAKAKFGTLDGAFHLAGTAPGGLIKLKTLALIESVLAPKVEGTLGLFEALNQEKVPFLVLFSSITALTGGFGQSDYGAANAFLDRFAQTVTGSTRCLSLNWDSWSEVGMATGLQLTGTLAQFNRERLSKGLGTEEGLEAMEAALGSGLSQVVISNIPVEEHLKEVQSLALAVNQVPERLVRPSAETSAEAVVLDLWRQYLARTEVEREDNFFDLGGDSLMAINLTAELGRTFGLTLPATLLMVNPTPRELAVYLEAQKHPEARPLEQYRFLVPVSKEVNAPPLFLFPTGGGYVVYYRDLARALGDSLCAFGFQARGLDGKDRPFESIEEMSQGFLEELLVKYPEGPCILGGASFGGLVAYETAQRLVELGREVSLLFLIDTPGPGQMPIRFENNVMIIKELFGRALELNEATLARQNSEEQVQYIAELARRANLPELLPPDFGVPFLEAVASHMKAMFSYEPKPYKGKDRILFFRHTEPLAEYAKRPELPWVELSRGEIDIRRVEGNHYTMNFDPNVAKIAAEIKARLRRG